MDFIAWVDLISPASQASQYLNGFNPKYQPKTPIQSSKPLCYPIPTINTPSKLLESLVALYTWTHTHTPLYIHLYPLTSNTTFIFIPPSPYSSYYPSPILNPQSSSPCLHLHLASSSYHPLTLLSPFLPHIFPIYLQLSSFFQLSLQKNLNSPPINANQSLNFPSNENSIMKIENENEMKTSC